MRKLFLLHSTRISIERRKEGKSLQSRIRAINILLTIFSIRLVRFRQAAHEPSLFFVFSDTNDMDFPSSSQTSPLFSSSGGLKNCKDEMKIKRKRGDNEDNAYAYSVFIFFPLLWRSFTLCVEDFRSITFFSCFSAFFTLQFRAESCKYSQISPLFLVVAFALFLLIFILIILIYGRSFCFLSVP